jgi:hypothetical protein
MVIAVAARQDVRITHHPSVKGSDAMQTLADSTSSTQGSFRRLIAIAVAAVLGAGIYDALRASHATESMSARDAVFTSAPSDLDLTVLDAQTRSQVQPWHWEVAGKATRPGGRDPSVQHMWNAVY